MYGNAEMYSWWVEQSWRGLQSLNAYVLIVVFVRHYLYLQYFNVVECQERDLDQCHSSSPESFSRLLRYPARSVVTFKEHTGIG